MTPGARVAAAIEVLDQIGDGAAAEQALTRWARASRFAGSKDRAAVRDHVFDVLRHWRSAAALGGGTSGRARMIGRLRGAGADLQALFSGEGHAPQPLTEVERAIQAAELPRAAALDLPDWLVDRFDASLGAEADQAALALKDRAPITVRVNAARASVASAVARLSEDGIVADANARADTALTVIEGARRLRQSRAYLSGDIELQDAASQAAIAHIAGTGRALDYCAGGGGKALALAARGWLVTAHDAEPARMRDIPSRAQRGGHQIEICETSALAGRAPFDAVLCDAPCSGSGTWRRTPDAKWRLTPDRLEALCAVQAHILDTAQHHVAQGGALYYATCSVLREENEAQVGAFVARHAAWFCEQEWRWPVDAAGDGFYLARLLRA